MIDTKYTPSGGCPTKEEICFLAEQDFTHIIGTVDI